MVDELGMYDRFLRSSTHVVAFDDYNGTCWHADGTQYIEYFNSELNRFIENIDDDSEFGYSRLSHLFDYLRMRR